MHRPIAFLAAASLTLAGLLAMPAPVSAAANPSIVHFDPSISGGVFTCTSSASAVRMNPGDALTLTLSGNNRATFTFDGPTGLVDVPVATGRPGTATFSTIGTYNLVSAWAFNCSLTVSVVSEPVEPPAPHDYYQEVGVPASGDCADVSNTVGHWPGFPIGGWSKSWAHWINDGAGGPVCVREVEQRSDGTIVLVG